MHTKLLKYVFLRCLKPSELFAVNINELKKNLPVNMLNNRPEINLTPLGSRYKNGLPTRVNLISKRSGVLKK